MDGNTKLGKTRRSASVTTVDGPKAFSYQHADSQIELVLVHVNPQDVPNGPWRTIEFWTANTMYGLDSSLHCIEISNRNPHETVPAGGKLVGSKLLGSQRRDGDHFSVSFPYPVPGMQAVFQFGEGSQHVTTSQVERVMLRVRMTEVQMVANQKPDWAKISTMFEV